MFNFHFILIKHTPTTQPGPVNKILTKQHLNKVAIVPEFFYVAAIKNHVHNTEFFWFSFILVPGNASAVHVPFSFTTLGTNVTNKLKDLIGVLWTNVTVSYAFDDQNGLFNINDDINLKQSISITET